MKNLIFEFIRKGHNRKVGILVAGLNENDKIIIGYALFHKNAEEAIGRKFSKEKGIEIAIGRATKCNNDFRDYPRSINADIINFIARCKRYYKGNEFAISDNAERFAKAIDWLNEVNGTIPEMLEDDDNCNCDVCKCDSNKTNA